MEVGTDHLVLPVAKLPLVMQLEIDIFFVRFVVVLITLWITLKIIKCGVGCCFRKKTKTVKDTKTD